MAALQRKSIHATAVVTDRSALLLLGEAGAGKSSLAAELLCLGAQLLSDDLVLLTAGEDLRAQAPPSAPHLIELRGIGLVEVPYAGGDHRVCAAVRLCPTAQPARLPEPASVTLLGIEVPLVEVPFVAGVGARIKLWWQMIEASTA